MICSKCGDYTDERSFATYRDRNGMKRRRGVCKHCRQKYQVDNFDRLQKYRQEYNAANRDKKALNAKARREAVRAVVDKIKSESPCMDCGRHFPPVAMDFDHIHGKNKSIATMYSQAYKIELILEEIKLCELVCACCHRIRTQSRKQNHAGNKKL